MQLGSVLFVAVMRILATMAGAAAMCSLHML